MHKELFDDAIGEVPPSTVDVDAVISRGRRAARLHRAANPVVAAGLAVVAVTGVVAYTMTGDDPAGGVAVGTQPSDGTSSSPAPGSGDVPPGATDPALPDGCSRPDLETAAELNTRLSQVVTAAFQAQRPDVSLTANAGAEYPTGVAHGPLEFFQVNATPGTDQSICGPDSYSMARATTNAPDGVGNIVVVVQPAPAGPAGNTCGATEEVYCEVVTGPGGDEILKSTSEFDGGTTATRVSIVRADGTSVIVESENVGTSVRSGDAATAAAPPLDHDQLVAIGTAPGMTLFP
jgi:hypothetical protein